LEDRHGRRRNFPWGHGYLIDGAHVAVTRPAAAPAEPHPVRSASGSIAMRDHTARTARDALIKEPLRSWAGRGPSLRVVEWPRVSSLDPLPGPGPGLLGPVSGRLPLRRHPIRATARARISQFAEANKTLRCLRFFAIPR
ncbi:MAG: DUF3097 family protein, partial [Luteitalea sp.]|nr:DUF3097 family protein [Luteitalea sp.]